MLRFARRALMTRDRPSFPGDAATKAAAQLNKPVATKGKPEAKKAPAAKGCGPTCTTPAPTRLNVDATTSAAVEQLLRYNENWASRVVEADPEFFASLAQQQTPQFLWIGCSDSRVPANQIVGLPPGEVFVHRNIANVVVASDINLQSVLQFAVDHLKVRHVIVCGHYGCGGVGAALNGVRLGLADLWVRHVRDVADKYVIDLERLPAEMPATQEGALATHPRLDTLCELNVVEQLRHIAESVTVRDHWHRGGRVALHGWAYGLADGRIRQLASIGPAEHSAVEKACDAAAQRLVAERLRAAGVQPKL